MTVALDGGRTGEGLFTCSAQGECRVQSARMVPCSALLGALRRESSRMPLNDLPVSGQARAAQASLCGAGSKQRAFCSLPLKFGESRTLYGPSAFVPAAKCNVEIQQQLGGLRRALDHISQGVARAGVCWPQDGTRLQMHEVGTSDQQPLCGRLASLVNGS